MPITEVRERRQSGNAAVGALVGVISWWVIVELAAARLRQLQDFDYPLWLPAGFLIVAGGATWALSGDRLRLAGGAVALVAISVIGFLLGDPVDALDVAATHPLDTIRRGSFESTLYVLAATWGLLATRQPRRRRSERES